LKSLTMLWMKLAHECASRCCTSATFDCKTVERRSKYEGLSFLTITLPTFGKDLEKGLDQMKVDRSLFQGFTWRAGLPLFLGGFLDRVFDRSSGVLLDEPDIDAIRSIRQLTLMFAKIQLKCSDARERAAMSSYIECEKEVKAHDAKLSSADMADFNRVSAILFRDLLTEVDRKVYYGEITPKHGPGATADKLRGNAKYRQSTWTDRLEEIFPSGEFLLPSWSYYSQLDDVTLLEPGSEKPVRVISVPKTQKTPRIIAVEPTAMQYAQQGILEAILEARFSGQVRKNSPWVASMFRVEDQGLNQSMALEGSLKGNLATLDLSEASDRVSNQLVRGLLRNHPHLHRAVDASRSRKADVPGHSIVRLAKFASMGSALTFPIEMMVFYTIIYLGISRELKTPLDRRAVKQLSDKVRVFGDDIIVPVDYVRSVVGALQTFGSVVNTGKSFWTGRFRESCGKEYYAGEDVSIVRVRQMLPTQRKDATGVISVVSLRNQLYHAGYWATVKWLDERIEDVIRHFPTVLPSSPVLGRHSFLGFETQRMHEHLHSPQVRGYVVSSRIPSDPLDGPGALLKFFLKRGGQPSVDRRHLERSGRPHAVDIKLRWASSV